MKLVDLLVGYIVGLCVREFVADHVYPCQPGHRDQVVEQLAGVEVGDNHWVPADYEKIRAENVERYGWDTAVLDLLGQLYSERTHFIFELIQNAEDAGARELAFELFEDRLEVRHDGRPFTEADVRGVCGVGQSGKSGDLTKIGKFGIGFKSVYAYTQTPHVYSFGERFRIEKFVRPYGVEPPAGEGEPALGTIFTFPFDHGSVPAAVAVQEIGAALNEIEPSTLLFLRSIERVRVGGAGVAGSVLERAEAARGGSGRRVTLAKGRGREEWFVWHRGLDAVGLAGLRVEIAFAVAGGADGGRRVVRLAQSPLVVFFPTVKETFLGFGIQGPYRTTPARDNVPEQDPANQELVRETAALLVEVLRELRDEGLLTVEVLEAMPVDVARFGDGAMLRPLFEAVREAVGREELVPVTGGGYAAAAELRLAGGAGLGDLLPPDRLGPLYGAGRAVAFADESITPDGTPVLWRYLREEIGVQEVTAAGVVERVTRDFLQAQPDEWIGEFYLFLYRHSALWMAPRSPGEAGGPARGRPIIRLEDGGHVAPFDSSGRPEAYLPGAGGTVLPTVRRAVADLPGCRRFLEALGLVEPDVVAEVLDVVLPRYVGLEITDLDEAQHGADVELVARALDEAPAGRMDVLLERVRETAFLVGENAATGERRLMPPPGLYLRRWDLEVYFAGNPDAWFASDGYGPWLVQLRGMGVRESVEFRVRGADQVGYVELVREFARHERGVDGFDPGAEIDGLDFALGHPSQERSEYVWNVLLTGNRHLVAGVVEKSHRGEFADASRESVRSLIGAAAVRAAWLPGADGEFHRPGEITIDELPAGFKRDDLLAKALGMVQPVVEEASRQLGLPARVLRGLMEHPDLVAMVERELKERLTD